MWRGRAEQKRKGNQKTRGQSGEKRGKETLRSGRARKKQKLTKGGENEKGRDGSSIKRGEAINDMEKKKKRRAHFGIECGGTTQGGTERIKVGER